MVWFVCLCMFVFCLLCYSFGGFAFVWFVPEVIAFLFSCWLCRMSVVVSSVWVLLVCYCSVFVPLRVCCSFVFVCDLLRIL